MVEFLPLPSGHSVDDVSFAFPSSYPCLWLIVITLSLIHCSLPNTIRDTPSRNLSGISNSPSSLPVYSMQHLYPELPFLFFCFSLPTILAVATSEVMRSLGAWVARSLRHPTLAQVMIPRFMGLSPVLGSVLTAWSLQPVSDSVSPSLSAPPPLSLYLSVFQK